MSLDRKKRYSFIGQSDYQKPDAGEKAPLKDEIRSVLLLANGRFFQNSEAVIRILSGLGGGWRLFGIFLLVPTNIRDSLYFFIAGRRYTWFGSAPSCGVNKSDFSS